MAFSVTVLGLLIGAIAFVISLVRDRLYGQDLSDLQFVAGRMLDARELTPRSRPAAAAAAAPPRTFVTPHAVAAATAPATRWKGWSTSSTSASSSRSPSCSPRSPRSNLSSLLTPETSPSTERGPTGRR